jgi:hypothetical protein
MSTLTERLDALYEFDREPVPENKLQGAGSFIGVSAGEHVAGTEFVIGPLFVAHGVAAGDLFTGLLLGNFLAVLSWAFITAPIAVKTRLNLYWHLRKITGPRVLFAYNLINALMFCFLAGAMISVAATAVGLPFNMIMPALNDFYPNSLEWNVVVLAVGAAVTTLAILGFEKQYCRMEKFAVELAGGINVGTNTFCLLFASHGNFLQGPSRLVYCRGAFCRVELHATATEPDMKTTAKLLSFLWALPQLSCRPFSFF